MKELNNRQELSTDQLIEIAAQAANAKRARSFIGDCIKQMTLGSINNSYPDYKFVQQSAEAKILSLVSIVSKCGEFNGSDTGIIISNLMSMKEDIASGKLVVNINNYRDFNSFIEANLLERLKDGSTQDASADNKLIDIMLKAANDRR